MHDVWATVFLCDHIKFIIASFFFFLTYYHFVFLLWDSLQTSINMLLKGKRAFFFLSYTDGIVCLHSTLRVLLPLRHDYFCTLVCVLALYVRTCWSGRWSRAACSCARAQRPYGMFSSCCGCVTAMECSFASLALRTPRACCFSTSSCEIIREIMLPI